MPNPEAQKKPTTFRELIGEINSETKGLSPADSIAFVQGFLEQNGYKYSYSGAPEKFDAHDQFERAIIGGNATDAQIFLCNGLYQNLVLQPEPKRTHAQQAA